MLLADPQKLEIRILDPPYDDRMDLYFIRISGNFSNSTGARRTSRITDASKNKHFWLRAPNLFNSILSRCTGLLASGKIENFSTINSQLQDDIVFANRDHTQSKSNPFA